MRSKTLSPNNSLKNYTGTMPLVSGMTPALVMNIGGPPIHCFVLLPVGGVGLSRRVVWAGLSKRVARVGLAVGERLSCMGEWVRLLHS